MPRQMAERATNPHFALARPRALGNSQFIKMIETKYEQLKVTLTEEQAMAQMQVALNEAADQMQAAGMGDVATTMSAAAATAATTTDRAETASQADDDGVTAADIFGGDDNSVVDETSPDDKLEEVVDVEDCLLYTSPSPRDS